MKSTNTRSWLGIILVFLGFMWILNNFDFLPFDLHYVIFSWPAILIVIGIFMLMNSKENAAGYILVGLGAFFLLPRIFPFFFHFAFRDFWPILLIILGLLILLRRRNPAPQPSSAGYSGIPGENFATEIADYIDEACIFSSCRRIINSQNFSGGKITSIFGGTHLDFTNAKLNQTEAVIDMLCLFGGVDIRVPADWRVLVNVTSIFGGFEDKRFLRTEDQTKGVLVVKGTALFGGGKIFN